MMKSTAVAIRICSREGSDDTIFGDEGADTIRGDYGNDWIYAGDDNDLVFGNRGDDRIDGGHGMMCLTAAPARTR